MGLGFSIQFPVHKRKGLLREQYEAYFKGLSSPVSGWDVFTFFGENWFEVRLVPFEESLYGEWVGDNLVMSSKTNSAGPGYHAYLIEVMDGLGVKPTRVDDETGYYKNRDFAALQAQMSQWLRSMSAVLTDALERDFSNFAVSVALDWLPQSDDQLVCCPLGNFDKAFFEDAKQGRNAGAEFFLWWNKSRDAMFYRNAALNMLLYTINWLASETEAERHDTAAVLACLEQAYTLDPNLQYPAAEWLELSNFSDNSALAQTISARFPNVGEPTVGYRRGNIATNVYGWRFTHSGMMHMDRDENGTLVQWDNDKTIRATTFTVEFKENLPNKSESLMESALDGTMEYVPFPLDINGCVAKIAHKRIDENGEAVWYTSLVAALDNNLLMLSLFYVNDNERQWALDVCASVRRNADNI